MLAMGFCVAMQLVMTGVGTLMTARSSIVLTNRIRFNMFTHVMASRLNGRTAMHTGDLLSRMEGDVKLCADFLCQVIPGVVSSVARLGAAFIFMVVMDWRLALLCSAIMPVVIICGSGMARKMRQMSRELRMMDSQVQAHVQENIQRRVVVNAMEHTNQVAETLDSLHDDLERKTMRRVDYTLRWRLALQCGFSLGYMVAFLWCLVGLRSGAITFGMMTAFLQLVGQLQRPVVDLTNRIPQFIQASVASDRLIEITALPVEERGRPIRLGASVGVKFENVSFTYSDGGPIVVNKFSHYFSPGSVTAILGETGVGKSTIAKLMLALMTPDEGEVLLYSKAPGNAGEQVVASSRTRCNFVYVPQGNTLLSGTIRENLLIGNPDVDDEKIREALHTAMAEFVYDFPDGLDTICAELGDGLSEGQAQRIAIARGLLRSGSVMLLDEPTSSLDPQTEKQLLERLSANLGNRTLIIITHRQVVADLCPERVNIK